jgi:hypothetical protein
MYFMFSQINFMAGIFARSSVVSFGSSAKLLHSSKPAENKEEAEMKLH